MAFTITDMAASVATNTAEAIPAGYAFDVGVAEPAFTHALSAVDFEFGATFLGTKAELQAMVRRFAALIELLPEDRPDGTVRSLVDLRKLGEDGYPLDVTD
ncbi:hypothetical protein BIV57_13430 [Mangrovactinospora gilvigrisea]|uniref:Uncharacterized protein n=1 Tax=Mangrovactinospora gilvigrisea TaxID=1428644 RepID=A0A1J7C604_9ACTN|nr:hypothetical protein [Mangrovactinospora gilvigrisea]OIV36984.1 hypothetical protein BIV57_13430 [Mangrovactinospora gilvigrisea]